MTGSYMFPPIGVAMIGVPPVTGVTKRIPSSDWLELVNATAPVEL